MKKILQICCLLIGLTAVSYAQVAHPAVGNAEEKAKGLQRQLTLTGDQTGKIAAIYKESTESFEKIKKAEHGNPDKLTKSGNSLRAATIKRSKEY